MLCQDSVLLSGRFLHADCRRRSNFLSDIYGLQDRRGWGSTERCQYFSFIGVRSILLKALLPGHGKRIQSHIPPHRLFLFFSTREFPPGSSAETPGEDHSLIQEYSEMIRLFDTKYGKKIMGCQGRIVEELLSGIVLMNNFLV